MKTKGRRMVDRPPHKQLCVDVTVHDALRSVCRARGLKLRDAANRAVQAYVAMNAGN